MRSWDAKTTSTPCPRNAATCPESIAGGACVAASTRHGRPARRAGNPISVAGQSTASVRSSGAFHETIGNAEAVRQGGRIVELGDPPCRQQHLVSSHVAEERLRLGTLQGGAVDEAADEEPVFAVFVLDRVGLGRASRLSVPPHPR